MTRADIVIVGGGAAGATAARTLLVEGETDRIVLLGGEPMAPYDRTDLSKAILAGTRDVPAPLYPDDLVDPRLTLRTGSVVRRLDLPAHEVVLDDGSAVGFGQLLLAPGAAPRDLPLPGRDLAGVHLVREWAAAPALRDAVRAGGNLVVIGGGLIGLEVAAAARSHGTQVTVIEAADRLMGRVLPPSVTAIVADLHAANGVELVVGTRPTELIGDRQRLTGVELADGRVLPADAVVIAIGVTPRTQLAADAGLEVHDGIVVDEHLRTSHPDVLAAGDAVRIRAADGRLRVRSEAWTPALGAGQHAARVLLGADGPYTEVPWMWSDQYDHKVQAAGAALDGLALVERGSVAEPDGLAVFGLDATGTVAGVAGVSRGARIGRTVRAAQLLIEQRVAVPVEQLQDPTVELRRLASSR